MPAQVSDIQLLLRARHALIVLDTDEQERAGGLLDSACSRLSLLRFVWTAAAGLRRLGETTPIYGTSKLDACLEHIAASGADNALYHLSGVTELFGDPERAARLNALLGPLCAVESTVVISGPASALPETIRRNAAVVTIKRPSDGEDLPDQATRTEILRLHLSKRKRSVDAFDLDALAKESSGFSGAELEQAVVSSLYRAYAERSALTQAHLLEEMGRTKPLSTTMAEPIAALRAWAQGRTTPAD